MEAQKIIFAVNPGATSTKCSLFSVSEEGVEEISSEDILHPENDISAFEKVSDQIDYRETAVNVFLERHLSADAEIIACAGRGGMLTPVPSGVIEINEELVNFSLFTPFYEHASNLGAPLAYRVAERHVCPAYISDPVAVDEFSGIARISGSPEFPRFSFVHALNVRAVVRKLAKKLNKPFEEMRCVVAHLGAGFSIAAFEEGRIVDNDNRMAEAAFTPERAGGVPPIPLVDACFSGKYSKDEIRGMLYGNGGLSAYLGTKDVKEVIRRIENGDGKAKLVLDAMIYQISKQISAMASVLKFNTDGVIITGGLAYSSYVTDGINARIGKVIQVHIYPGSSENEALAENALRVLNGKEKAVTWPLKKDVL